jgi:hypothetical protein
MQHCAAHNLLTTNLEITMTSINLDLLTEYNTKALESMRAFGDLSVANVQRFIDKQVELNNSLLQAGLASQKEMATAKTPAEAMQSANSLVHTWAEALSGYVKEAGENAVKARDDLKVVIDEAVKMNTEYATKVYESGVETVKKAAKKAA